MPDWVAKHRESIRFVVFMTIGVLLIGIGILDGEAATIALGAGAIGLPGFQNASRHET